MVYVFFNFYNSASRAYFLIISKNYFHKYFICCKHIVLEYSFYMALPFPEKHDGFILKSTNIMTDDNTSNFVP